LRQQWHQNGQTLSEAECGRLAEIDELHGQFSRMIWMLDQKCEELEKMLAKWETLQQLQKEMSDLKDKFKRGVQDKRSLLDGWEGFVQSFTDTQKISDVDAKN
jgi:predicted nuclease with TOPRIM domain